MKKTIIISAFLFCFVSLSSAQDYNTAIGLRGGLSNGLTFKQFLGDKAAVELIATTRWKGLEITGLYELHNGGLGVDGLTWFYGLGGHIGFWKGDNASWGTPGESYTVIGVDGNLGLDYKFPKHPINLSLDWKPAFNLVGYSGFWGDGGALSIRYAF